MGEAGRSYLILARFAYSLRAMIEGGSSLRLFPLGVVLFPGLPIPLHIFEERYKQMISECLSGDEPFGIVFVDEARMRKVGCSARIEEVIRRYDDGRLDIVARGERRFRIHELDESNAYLAGTVSYISDEEEPDSEAVEGLVSQALNQLGRLAKITGSEIDLDAIHAMEPERISYLISGLDAFSSEENQLFLELPTASQRLLSCAQTLAHVVQNYDIKNEANELLPEGRLLHRFN